MTVACPIMEDLTMLLLAASLLMGAAVVLYRKTGTRAYMLSMALSIVAIGAVTMDPSMSEGYDLTFSIIPPFAVLMVSVMGMLFSKED